MAWRSFATPFVSSSEPREETFMRFTPAESAACERLLQLALDEDLGTVGDLTSLAVIPADLQGQAVFVARTPGVLAGLPAVALTFARIDPAVVFSPLVDDGTPTTPGLHLATVRGPMRSILSGERTALNFLQRLSGVATQTAKHGALLAGLKCQLLDTRKTTPGWRLLEKYAVRQGGGHNHRMGLCDGVLIKDNHLAALGSIPNPVAQAVRLARQKHGLDVPLEVEVDTLEQLDEALAARPDIVLLDNMGPDKLREAVRRRDSFAPGVLLESSGGVTLNTLRALAESGVDRISVGALTHSAVALDIGLDYLMG
jgi:nicotinate-nucleotide pyrophosphorylase (carboxylating)